MRVLVVDDEPLTRTALASVLSQRPDVEAFDLAEDAHQALARLQACSYDLLLLDIQMPELSGLRLVELLAEQQEPIPAIVFVTAHQEHAVEAFKKRAVDYVLKPFGAERIHEALDVAARRSSEERAARLLGALRELQLASGRGVRVAIKDKGRVVFADTSELISAEAEGNYVLVQHKGGSYLLREPLSEVAEKLKPYGFIQIHRSVLVNGAQVGTIAPGVGKEWILRMKSGKEYCVTPKYRENLNNLAQFAIGADGFVPGRRGEP